MVEQAQARNAVAVESGHVDLRQGSVGNLPFDNNCFDKAVAINSMQVWPDALAGLREMLRVTKPGGRIALGFTPYLGQPNRGLKEKSSLSASQSTGGGDKQRFLRVGDKAISNMTHALRRLGNETEEWSCVDIATLLTIESLPAPLFPLRAW
jgi:ubiquinone/menaquinone biosynthesis C-methylase UbiE